MIPVTAWKFKCTTTGTVNVCMYSSFCLWLPLTINRKYFLASSRQTAHVLGGTDRSRLNINANSSCFEVKGNMIYASVLCVQTSHTLLTKSFLTLVRQFLCCKMEFPCLTRASGYVFHQIQRSCGKLPKQMKEIFSFTCIAWPLSELALRFSV